MVYMMANAYKRVAGHAYHSSPSKHFKHLQCISESESPAEKNSQEASEISFDFDYESCSDLVNLPAITEIEILKCLKKRYEKDRIYTSMRNHLISMNPGRPLPRLYSAEEMSRVEPNEAHLFAVGANALKNVFQSEEGGNAFVVISGESGAGKTENTKHLLKYFLHHNVSNSKFDASFLESSILHIFSVLEAFGNAPTSHNRNSSRFGKCVRVEYLDNRRQIGGINISTFLLEKTRVLHLKHSPRTCFHVFDSMTSMPSAEQQRLFVNLPPEAADENDPATAVRQPFIPWQELHGALVALRVAPTDLEQLARVLSALRLCAGLCFSAGAGEEPSGPPSSLLLLLPDGRDSELRLSRIALLLGARVEDLKRTLTQHKFNSRRESVYIRSCSVLEAETRVETLMKFMYQLLFHWITNFCEQHFGCRGQYSIGIIDLYGFESLAVNGFEQLCINFANERLQQFFVESFLQATVADYESEGVPFDCGISCQMENFETSAMIGRGIFPLLEEECRMMRVNSTAARLAQRFDTELRAAYPRALLRVNCCQPSPDLLVRHYAGTVRYELAEFLPLNVDRMPADVFDFLASSAAGQWLMRLASPDGAALAAAAQRYKQRPAVCAQFQASLDALLGLIKGAKHVAYVRCLKPRRDVGVAAAGGSDGGGGGGGGAFDASLVQQQLASCGVAATVRVCRGASHSVRLPYELFHRRYAVLLGARLSPTTPASPALFADLESSFLEQHQLPRTPTRSGRRSARRRRTCASEVDELRRVCATIVERAGVAPAMAQFGRARLFLTTAQAEQLEAARERLRHWAVKVLQAGARQWLQRRRREIAARTLQRHLRRWLATRRPTVGPRGDGATDPPQSPPPAASLDFHHRRRDIVSRRYIPSSPVSLRGGGGGSVRRQSVVRHRLLPYSNLRPLNSVPSVHASYKLSITNCL